MPAQMRGLHADVNDVVRVTSAYLLGYVVPLLITGRLGDRFGPKNLNLVGLAALSFARPAHLQRAPEAATSEPEAPA